MDETTQTVARVVTVSVDGARWVDRFGVGGAPDLGKYADQQVTECLSEGFGVLLAAGGSLSVAPVEDVELRMRREMAVALRVAGLMGPGGVPSWDQLLMVAARSVPREVHVVSRDDGVGELYGFVDEDQAREYADLFPGAEWAELLVNDERAGAEIIAEERRSRAEGARVLRWVCESNAESLGYDAEGYLDGKWVLEAPGDEWLMDLDGVPISSEALGPWLAELGLRLVEPLPSNFGAAFLVEDVDA